MNLFGSLTTDINEVFLLDAQVLDETLELLINKSLEFLVNLCVLQLVLIFIFKPYAILIYEVNNRSLPNRRLQKLCNYIKYPVLAFHLY